MFKPGEGVPAGTPSSKNHKLNSSQLKPEGDLLSQYLKISGLVKLQVQLNPGAQDNETDLIFLSLVSSLETLLSIKTAKQLQILFYWLSHLAESSPHTTPRSQIKLSVALAKGHEPVLIGRLGPLFYCRQAREERMVRSM